MSVYPPKGPPWRGLQQLRDFKRCLSRKPDGTVACPAFHLVLVLTLDVLPWRGPGHEPRPAEARDAPLIVLGFGCSSGLHRRLIVAVSGGEEKETRRDELHRPDTCQPAEQQLFLTRHRPSDRKQDAALLPVVVWWDWSRLWRLKVRKSPRAGGAESSQEAQRGVNSNTKQRSRGAEQKPANFGLFGLCRQLRVTPPQSALSPPSVRRLSTVCPSPLTFLSRGRGVKRKTTFTAGLDSECETSSSVLL
ncbi:uncharacterized protein LOC141796649 [Halichoeres trimaculatus]|uniref:uncharacterized protein LOC141796649 n=1 Tax=Halichoeres trimaculatus TaxID=147232 RepID=UPI003D9DD664